MHGQERSSASSGRKKRDSNAGGSNNPTGRVIKRRAPTACQGCRARKVRCNVLEYGPPCTNCRLDGIHCTVSMGKRRLRFANSNAETILESLITERQPARIEIDISDGSEEEPRRWIHHHDKRAQLPPYPQRTHSHTKGGSLDADHQPHFIYQTADPAGHNSPPMQDDHASLGVPPLNAQSPPIGMIGRSISPVRRPPPPLPSWVKPLPDRIEVDDVDFLWRKGALTIPDNPLRDELLGCFIEWVYPWTPMIDISDFLRTISREDGTAGKLSLLVIQAIMFAGVGFADLAILQQAGFQTHKDAKKHFFRKTKLLYDFEYENDRVSLIQALLLMTYWHESPDDQKDIWHWLGIATSLAHTIGLHRDPGSLAMDPKQKHLRKRIWWSLYMRDRLVALAMRRSPRIQQKDCDVPILDTGDFDIQPIGHEITCIPPNRCTFIHDEDKLRRLAKLCVEETKLCVIISHVLQVQYAVVRVEQGAPVENSNTKTTMVLLPRKNLPNPSEIDFCDMELTDWTVKLPESIVYRSSGGTDSSNGTEGLILHRAVLSMLYYTAINILHRPQFLSSGSRVEAFQPRPSSSSSLLSSAAIPSPSLCEPSLEKTRAAAQMVTHTAMELSSLNLIRYLPTVGVTAMVHAAIMHLVDVRSPDENIRRSSLNGLAQCMGVLEQLRDIYIAADYASFLLYQGISKAGIEMPAIPVPTSSDSPAATGMTPSFSAMDPKQYVLSTMTCGGCSSPAHNHSHSHNPAQPLPSVFNPPQQSDNSETLNTFFTSPPKTGDPALMAVNHSNEENTAHNMYSIDDADTNFMFNDRRMNVSAEPTSAAFFDKLAQMQELDFGPYEDDLALFDSSNDFGYKLDWLTPLGGPI